MKNLFRRLFGNAPQTAILTQRDSLISVQDESDNATRHQLVQMLLRALLRKHGIPTHWIELQILVVPGKVQGLGMHLRLVVKQWDVRLMNHVQAFQDTLLADITRYEAHALEWLHGISWQLEMSDSCPYTSLPGKPFWDTPAQTGAPAPAAPAPRLSRHDEKAHLELLFSLRDKEGSSHPVSERAFPAFEDTQPSIDSKPA